jgi:oligopeptide/dipeptide ABC transporter ATP-binding protein
MILQDPQTSLNPVFTIGNQLEEAIGTHRTNGKRKSLTELALQALRMVQVAAPERRLHDYPHQMSGGMKQRVVGAMAIASHPRVLIADEPTTALDVTIQAQYLRLLKQLQHETGVSIIFITHDFGVVAKMCDRAAVMYAGRIVEQGSVRELFNRPAHPYTQALLASVPRIDERVDKLYSIEGQPPALFDLPPGCRFAPRCPHAHDRCRVEYPPPFVVEAPLPARPGVRGPLDAHPPRDRGQDRGGEHHAACWMLEETWQSTP